MIKAFAVLLVAIAVATAFDITALTSGTATTGSFAITLTQEDADFQLNVYSLWLNENVSSAAIELQDTTVGGSGWCEVSAYFSAREIPCGDEWDTESNDWYPCREAYSTYASTTATSIDIYPSSWSEEIYVTLGGYVYISTSRYYTSYYDEVCTYSITPTVTECGNNQVNIFSTSAVAQCVDVNRVNATGFTGSPTTASSSAWSLHRIWLPFGVSSVHVYGNVTSDVTPDLYTQERFIPGTGTYFTYHTASYEDTGIYLFDEWIWLPRSGYFYLGFTGATITGGSVTVTTNVCNNGMGGWNCTYMVSNVTDASVVNADILVTNAATCSAPFCDVFHYIVLQANAAINQNINMSFAEVTESSGTLYYRKDGWVDDSSNLYISSSNWEYLSTTPTNFALKPHDYAFPGILVIGVSNEGAAASTLHVTVNATSASATSGTPTSAGTTGPATEAATTGAASNIAACVALIALCIAALF